MAALKGKKFVIFASGLASSILLSHATDKYYFSREDISEIPGVLRAKQRAYSAIRKEVRGVLNNSFKAFETIMQCRVFLWLHKTIASVETALFKPIFIEYIWSHN